MYFYSSLVLAHGNVTSAMPMPEQRGPIMDRRLGIEPPPMEGALAGVPGAPNGERADGETARAQGPPKSTIQKIRNNFPETWIWENMIMGYL